MTLLPRRLVSGIDRATDRTAADLAYKGLTERALNPTQSRAGVLTGERPPPSNDLAPFAATQGHSRAAPALDAYTIAKPDLRKFLVPTLLATGEDAHPVNRLTVDRLAALLPAVRRIDIPLAENEWTHRFREKAATNSTPRSPIWSSTVESSPDDVATHGAEPRAH